MKKTTKLIDCKCEIGAGRLKLIECKYEVGAEMELWGFHAGDILSKNIKGEFGDFHGTDFDNTHLFKMVEKEIVSQYAVDPKGFVLLERPGMLFKVGDQVRINISVSHHEHGKVIVMNPYDNTPFPYLVEYLASVNHQNEPWFPRQYSSEIRRMWSSEEILTLLSE